MYEDDSLSEADCYDAVLSAVEDGDENAKTQLAWLKLSRRIKSDAEEAVALLEERVGKGDEEAMWLLGLCLEYGIGINEDIERAEILYEQSYEYGSTTGFLLASKQEEAPRGSGHLLMNGW